MKKWILLIAGTLMFSGAVMADCGTCEASAKDAKKKAACEMNGAQNKAACEMKKMECGPDCKKPCCAGKEMMDKSSAQAQEKSKKWWKFGFGK